MGWRDLFAVDRITDDDSGGGYTSNNFLGRSNQRRAKYPGVSDPIADIGPLGRREEYASQIEMPTINEPWKPPTARRNFTMDDFSEQGPAMTEYLQHIQNTPDSSTGDYNPSIWRRMLAGLAGGAAGGSGGALQGIKAAQTINEMPYRRAVEDYERKGSALESAAKIEDATRKQQLQYHKQILDQDEADKDRQVKWYNSQIADRKAQATAERVKITDQIRLATNEATAQRLRNDLERNNQKHQEAIDRLEVQKYQAESGRMQAGAAQTNAAANTARSGAYTGYMDRLGTQKPMSPASVGITRRIVEEEIKNEHPEWLDDKGAVKDTRRYEDEIQRRLLMRIPSYNKDRMLPAENEPDNPYEFVP